MTAAPELGQLQLLDLSKVEIHASNPRKDVGDLTELAASIKSAGVLEPIVVVRKNGHYEAVTGSRRTAASRLAGMKSIPARVMEMDEAQVAAAALIENLQRKDLAPLEEAEAFSRYLTLTGATQKQLGERVGRAPSTIANALRLLEAPAEVRAALAAHQVTAAHARVLLQVKDPAALSKVITKSGKIPTRYDGEFKLEEISVERLEEVVAEINEDLETTGTVATAAAKAALAAAQAKHPKATITWRKTRQNLGRGELVDMIEALGKAPAAIAGPISQDGHKSVRPAAHEKACGCVAFEIRPERESYQRRPGAGEWHARAKFVLDPICMDRKKYAKVHRADGSRPKAASGNDPKALERQAREQEKRIGREVDEELSVRTKAHRGGAEQQLFEKLTALKWDGDVALLFAYHLLINESLYTEGAGLMAWDRLTKMKPKQIQKVLLSKIAQDLAMDLSFHMSEDPLKSAVATRFGIKVAEPKKAKR